MRGRTEYAICQQTLAYLESAQEGPVLINKENTSLKPQTIAREIPIPQCSNQKRMSSPVHHIYLSLKKKRRRKEGKAHVTPQI